MGHRKGYAKGWAHSIPPRPSKSTSFTLAIPGPMIKKVLKHLGLEQADQEQFWSIEERNRPSF